MGPLAQLRALAAIHRMSAMRLVTFLVPAFRIRPPMMRLSGQSPSQLAKASALRRQPRAAELPRHTTHRADTRARLGGHDPPAPARDGLRRGLPLRPLIAGEERPAQGRDPRDRRRYAGGQRRHEGHRAQGRWERLERLRGNSRHVRRHPGTGRRRPPADGPLAEGQESLRQPHRADEGRHRAPRV